MNGLKLNLSPQAVVLNAFLISFCITLGIGVGVWVVHHLPT